MSIPEATDWVTVLETPAGALAIHANLSGVVRVRWLTGDRSGIPPRDAHILLDKARAALARYFADPRRAPTDIPLAPVRATPFQRRVWRAMRALPPGQPVTYGQLAAGLGSSARAVGNAAAANPWPLVVPCHRVVGRHDLGGYLGETGEGGGLRIKSWLLDWEKREVHGGYG